MFLRVVCFIIILLILGLIFFLFHREPFKETYDCICAFDLDNTITCGIDRASAAIAYCKSRGAKIAINTARPSKWYSDLDLVGLGLHPDDFDSDFYHGEALQCSFGDKRCFEDTISATKVKHLHTIANKWNVKPQRVILFDDQWSNIERARSDGFSTVFANHDDCGLPSNTIEQIDKILSI
jgi:hypothetical protein